MIFVDKSSILGQFQFYTNLLNSNIVKMAQAFDKKDKQNSIKRCKTAKTYLLILIDLINKLEKYIDDDFQE